MFHSFLKNIILTGIALSFGQVDIFGPDKTTPAEVEVTTKVRCSSDVAEVSYIVQSPGPDRLTSASINGRAVSSSNLAAINLKIVTDQIERISLQACPGGNGKDRNAIELYLELEETAGKRIFILLLNREGMLIIE